MDIVTGPRDIHENALNLPFISIKLREERVKLGFKQTAFAEKLGIGLKTLRKIEQGDLSVNFQKLKFIFNCIGFDLIPDDLVISPKKKNEKIYTKEEVVDLLGKISAVFIAKYQIEGISLFGSYAKGSAGIDSDIDILIRGKTKLSFEQEDEFQIILETLFDGKKVDLTLEKNLREDLREEILRSQIDI